MYENVAPTEQATAVLPTAVGQHDYNFFIFQYDELVESPG